MSDHWDFYLCHVEDEPASIFLDMGIRSEVPMENLPNLAWLRLYMRQPRPDGLSSSEEFDKLKEIEDHIQSFIDEQTVAYVGRDTSGGTRDFYFYTSNAHQLESSLGVAMVTYSDYEYELGNREDASWSAYLDFLYPTPRAYQTMKNQQVIEKLRDEGDQLESQREICHWIYFTSADTRSSYQTKAEQLGYSFYDQTDPDEERDNYGLVLAREDAADYASINEATLTLFDLAEELGGEYDGWETPVVKAQKE